MAIPGVMGCCTSSLYRTTRASKNAVNPVLTDNQPGVCRQRSYREETRMSNEDEDLLVSHAEDQPTSAWRVPTSLSTLTPEAASKIASELHRWGRMTGVFSIILMVTWLVVGALASPPQSGPYPTGPAVIGSSLLWPGVVLAILAAIGLFAGFGFD